MGTTLGSDSSLDQDKTLACRTCGMPPHRPLDPPGRRCDPRKTRMTATPYLEDGTPYRNDHAACRGLAGRRRDLHKTKDDPQDDCHT